MMTYNTLQERRYAFPLTELGSSDVIRHHTKGEKLNTLRKQRDGFVETDAASSSWGQVYTRDLHIAGVKPEQIAGYLSGLQKAGYYRKIDKYFGMVRLCTDPRNDTQRG